MSLQVDKSIGTDNDFLTEDDFLSSTFHSHHGYHHHHGHHGHHGHHHHRHHVFDMSYDSSVQDIDSISQISAMDSASQTGLGGGGGSVVDGGGSACCYAASSSSPSKFHAQSKSFSSDSNIHRSVSEHPNNGKGVGNGTGAAAAGGGAGNIRRGQFPYAYIRSRLSVLPEEQAGQLSRRESMNQAGDEMSAARSEIIVKGRRSRSSGEAATAAAQDDDDGAGEDRDSELAYGNHNTSLRMRKMALRRKRSLSVADIQAAPPPPPAFEDGKKNSGVRRLTHLRSEESGYDSDATRKSSPRGSLKPAPNSVSGTDLEVTSSSSSSSRRGGDTDSMSTGSDDSGAGSSENKEDARPTATGNVAAKSAAIESMCSAPPKKPGPEIKKPPRKSKLPEATFRTSSKPSGMQPESFLAAAGVGRRFKKNGEDLAEPELVEAPGGALNALTSKRFKMLRLNKNESSSSSSDFGSNCGEMGIVISKRRHPQKGTTGYVIAHIEEGGIAER